MCKSVPQMPVFFTRIRTSLMPISGSAMSASHKPRPALLLTKARTVAVLLYHSLCHQNHALRIYHREPMKAITIIPGQKDSACVKDVPEPGESEGDVLVRALALGICGSDFELISAEYGWAPPGSDHLILGHESLGRVEDAPENTGFAKNDLVVGVVRRPDPVPCLACAVDQWDMCRNGKYTERGIKERNGFGSELWRNESRFLVKLDPGLSDVGVLMEPASVLAKAWDHITRIGERAEWKPRTVLI